VTSVSLHPLLADVGRSNALAPVAGAVMRASDKRPPATGRRAIAAANASTTTRVAQLGNGPTFLRQGPVASLLYRLPDDRAGHHVHYGTRRSNVVVLRHPEAYMAGVVEDLASCR
jgi:hypothetical protein